MTFGQCFGLCREVAGGADIGWQVAELSRSVHAVADGRTVAEAFVGGCGIGFTGCPVGEAFEFFRVGFAAVVVFVAGGLQAARDDAGFPLCVVR